MAEVVSNPRILQRLDKEFSDLQSEPIPGVTIERSDQTHWTVIMNGPEGTPYEGGRFHVSCVFIKQYPNKPPNANFQTKIYHPNIRMEDGEVCMQAMAHDWKPVNPCRIILEKFHSILVNPTAEQPLEPEIANLFMNDRAQFNETARKFTQEHAS